MSLLDKGKEGDVAGVSHEWDLAGGGAEQGRARQVLDVV